MLGCTARSRFSAVGLRGQDEPLAFLHRRAAVVGRQRVSICISGMVASTSGEHIIGKKF